MACPMRWSSDILLSISDEMQQKSYRFVRFYDWLSKLDFGAKMQIRNETV